LNPLSSVIAADAIVEPPLTSEAVDANIPKMIEFRFVQGTSNKYWKVGVNGCDLIVEFGRVGTKGQRVIKTFDDEDRAKREAIKLTLEKTRKGYEEFG
jgi:predicted DNA-binding WGR domain protein